MTSEGCNMDFESMELDKLDVQKKAKIIFMGTPQFSVPVLEGLIKNFNVRAVVTQPNRLKKSGELVAPPVRELADKHLILTIQPEEISAAIEEIISLEPDLIITCAYGQILPKQLLEYPKYGCINIHASLLPKLRGGAPIHRAIMKGFSKTGVTIMKMDEGIDTGDIIAQREIPIAFDDNASSLHDKLSYLGRDLLLDTLPKILTNDYELIPQDNRSATYAFNLQKKDEKIDFNNAVKKIYDQIRGLSEWPGAYCLFDDKRLKVYQARMSDNYCEGALPGEITNIYEDGFGVKTANREIVFLRVQPEGKKIMPASDFINGLQNQTKVIGRFLK